VLAYFAKLRIDVFMEKKQENLLQ
jgi:hypothetical protein